MTVSDSQVTVTVTAVILVRVVIMYKGDSKTVNINKTFYLYISFLSFFEFLLSLMILITKILWESKKKIGDGYCHQSVTLRGKNDYIQFR